MACVDPVAEAHAVEDNAQPAISQFGSKSIGLLAGVALLVNNITGPGVPSLPNVFVEAGWLAPSICILCVWTITTLSASMYCEAMRNIPGNEHFRGRVEYTTIVKHYFGPRWYLAAQVGLNGALQSLNVVSIIQSAQVMDNTISAVFGRSCGLNVTPFANVLTNSHGHSSIVPESSNWVSCWDTNNLEHGNAWGCHVVFTCGLLVTAALALPCGRWNLDDNMKIQTAAFMLTIGCWVLWVVVSLASIRLDGGGIPAVNTDPVTGSQAGVLGAILFNFGFVTTVPSWINEKRPNVSANKSLWGATTICIAVFFAVGLSGALAFHEVLQGTVTNTCARQVQESSYNCPNELLQLFSATGGSAAWSAGPIVTWLVKGSVFLFPIVAVVSSIPVFSIVVKYNMIENGFSGRFSFFWGVILPWIVAAPLLYMPNVLSQVINFTSLVFVTLTDFVVPLAIYIFLLRSRQGAARQRALSLGRGLVEDTCESSDCSESRTSSTRSSASPPVWEIQGVHEHYAFPRRLGLSVRCKASCAFFMAGLLIAASSMAIMITLQDGKYRIDAQVCSLVGN